MKTIIKLTLSLFVISIAGCTTFKAHRHHIGTWEADIQEESKLTWTLDEMTVTYEMPGDTTTSTYSIDYTQEPIWFDSVIGEAKVRCIMEFMGNDTFRITGEDDEGEPRPISFEGAEHILIFKRKEL